MVTQDFVGVKVGHDRNTETEERRRAQRASQEAESGRTVCRWPTETWLRDETP